MIWGFHSPCKIQIRTLKFQVQRIVLALEDVLLKDSCFALLRKVCLFIFSGETTVLNYESTYNWYCTFEKCFVSNNASRLMDSQLRIAAGKDGSMKQAFMPTLYFLAWSLVKHLHFPYWLRTATVDQINNIQLKKKKSY